MIERKPWLPPRWVIRSAWAIHRAIYRLSGGRRGLRPPTDDQYGMLRLRTIGRTTGEERQAILGFIEDGPRLVTMAMNGWSDPEPAWWLNLQAHPDAAVDLKDGSRNVTARVADDHERSRLWPRLVQSSPDLDRYSTLRSRETAIVILEPRTSTR